MENGKMDYIKAATFITDEERWLEKLAIGVGVILVSSVLTIILVGFLGFFIVAGYTVRLLQNVQARKPQVLPEWNDWSGDLKRGFKLVVVGIVWTLGVWIFMLPLIVGGVMSGSDSGFIGFMGVMLTMTASCFMMLYTIFILLAQPGFTIAFAKDEHIRSGLALSNIWTWTRANLGQVIIAAIAVAVASFVISTAGMLVGSLLCLVGLVLTVPLAMLITYIYQFHLYGQLADLYPYPHDENRPVATEEVDEEKAAEPVVGLLGTEVAATSDASEVDSSVITETVADVSVETSDQVESMDASAIEARDTIGEVTAPIVTEELGDATVETPEQAESTDAPAPSDEASEDKPDA